MPRKYVTIRQLRMTATQQNINRSSAREIEQHEQRENFHVTQNMDEIANPTTPNMVVTDDVPTNLEPLPLEGNEVRRVSASGSKTRRHARGDFVGPPDGKRYVVEWDSNGCPIGEGGKQLNRRLACFAKQGEFWPIHKKWLHIDILAFEDTWKTLVTQFDLNGHKNACAYCFKVINSRWRDWKAHLKIKYFKKYETDEDRITNRDPRADEDQFRILLDLWKTPESQRISTVNSTNRLKRKMNHHTGSSSFAQLRNKMRNENGKSPSKLQVIMKAYGKKSDSTSNEVLNQINEQITSQQSENTEKPQEEIEELAIASVMGRDKADRVRGAGIGAAPTKKKFNMNTIGEVMKLQEEFDQYKLDMQKKFESFIQTVSTRIGMNEENLVGNPTTPTSNVASNSSKAPS